VSAHRGAEKGVEAVPILADSRFFDPTGMIDWIVTAL